jgi:hypothetical protein
VRYALGESPAKKDDQEEKKSEIPTGLKSLVRYFAADNPYDDQRIDPEKDSVKAAILLENVESLEFQFWNMTGRRWETSLKSIQGGENSLRGVKLMVTWYDSTGNKRTVSRIYRNHWPMEVPQDNVTPTPAPGATTTGTAGGSATSGQAGGTVAN